MSVEHVEVLVEEPSMEAALSLLLPRLLGDLSFAVYSHQCKEELLARLPGRLLFRVRLSPYFTRSEGSRIASG